MDQLKLEAQAKTLVKAPRDRVYDAFTSAKGLDAWFTKGAEVDASPGGRIVFRWKDWGVDGGDFTAEGRVLEAKRPERFVFQWWDKEPAKATTVEILFEDRGERTVVRVREYGFATGQQGIDSLVGNTAGWAECLTLAKVYIEHKVVY